MKHEGLEALEWRALVGEVTLVAACEEALANADVRVTLEWADALEEYHDELARQEVFLELKYDALQEEVSMLRDHL